MELSIAHAGDRRLYAEELPSALHLASLSADSRADCVIIGGGYTGVSTALHLAEQGAKVALLEAREIGWGAAGRNGGQVNAGLKHEPEEMLRDLGPIFGSRLADFSLNAPDKLFELVERLQIKCSAERHGTLRVAVSSRHATNVEQASAQWSRFGARVQYWGTERLARELGTDHYVGGMFDAGGGSVNPLALVRGLAGAAQAAGASLFERSPAISIRREGSTWEVRTPAAALRADRVLIATQAYTGALWPGLRESLVPVYSSIIASEPLPAELASSVLPGKQVVYEAGNVTAYFRRDHSNRLLMGGRGVQQPADNFHSYRHLVSYATRLWPSLTDVRWTHWWNGQLAISPDGYPKFHCLGPGLFALVGYYRGVCLGTALGAELARVLMGGSLESFILPATSVEKIAFHRYWKTGVALRVLWGRLQDAVGF